MTSFDNDLYASDLVGIPILARHGVSSLDFPKFSLWISVSSQTDNRRTTIMFPFITLAKWFLLSNSGQNEVTLLALYRTSSFSHFPTSPMFLHNAHQTCFKLGRYSEVPDRGHWFDEVFDDPVVLDFIDKLLLNEKASTPTEYLEFTLTTANPDETGSKYGFRIMELDTPGRYALLPSL